VVARNIANHACYRFLRVTRLTIEDQAGNLIWDMRDGGPRLVDGFFRSGFEKTFRLPQDTVRCDSPGPYLALVTVGPTPPVATTSHAARSPVATPSRHG